MKPETKNQRRRKMETGRFCYTILAPQFDENGFIPSAIVEGEKGHHPMMGGGDCSIPWYWGKTLKEAEKVCKSKNADLGITEEEAIKMVLASMF